MTSFKPIWASPERPLEITRPPVEEEAPPAVFQPLWGSPSPGTAFQAGAALVAERMVSTFVPTGGLSLVLPAAVPEPAVIAPDVEVPADAALADAAVAAADSGDAAWSEQEFTAEPALPATEPSDEIAAFGAAIDEVAELSPPDPAPVVADEPVPEPVLVAAPPPAPVIVGVPPEEHEAALAAARQAAWDAGRQSAIDELQQALDAERAALRAAVDAVREAVTDTRTLAEPVKRLALHLAEQLVRGELTTSGEAIRRLVDGCLAEIDPREAVALRLHPEDVAQFEAQLGGEPDVTVTPDATLARGSVRLELTEGWVEDLIEDRLDTLSRTLLDEPWTRKTAPEPQQRRVPAPVEPQQPATAPRKAVRTLADDDEDVIYAEPFAPRPPVAAYREAAVLEHDA